MAQWTRHWPLQRGAVLLLDEIDLASNKILCLQSILEGKEFPQEDWQMGCTRRRFQVFATANTKGKGSDDGRFIGTNVLNEAFLERFPVTFERGYPTPAQEIKILEVLLVTSMLLLPTSVSVLQIGQTSFARPSTMVVLRRLFPPAVWFTFFVPIVSLVTKKRHCKSVSTVLMMTLSKHSLNCMIRLMLTLTFLHLTKMQ